MEKKDNTVLKNISLSEKPTYKKGFVKYVKRGEVNNRLFNDKGNYYKNKYKNKVFGINKKKFITAKRLKYIEEIPNKLYSRRKYRIKKLNIAYIKAQMRLKARLGDEEKNVKKKKSVDLRKLNKKKFKYFARYLGMLTMRGNTVQLENSFLFILRKIKKIHLDTYTLLGYLTRVVNQVRPYAIIVSQKKGSITYRIPLYTTPNREVFQGLYWLINESCGLKKGDFKYCLLKEFINLSLRTGKVMRIKAHFHKLVQRNRSMIKKLRK
jgi:ribosomal protein S7